MQKAKNDGTLPMDDHNTRIIVFGDDPNTVRTVAEAIAKEAFHNVACFGGSAATWSRRQVIALTHRNRPSSREPYS